MEILFSVLFFVCSFSFVTSAEIHHEKRVNNQTVWQIAQHLATTSPYWTTYLPNNTGTPVPQGCDAQPLHINYLARHGARQPTSSVTKALSSLQKTMEKYGPFITNPNFSWMQYWQSPYQLQSQGDLTNIGEEEHYNTSKRFLQRYPSLFGLPYHSEIYPIQTAQIERCARSGNAFGFGLFEDTGILGPQKYQAFYSYSDTLDQDVLCFFDNCPNYVNNVDNNPFYSSESEAWLNLNMNPLINRILALLAFNNASNAWPLTSTDVQNLYTACTFDVATFSNTTRFCSLFTQQDIEMFEYSEDLSNYYIKGLGTPLAYQISCPLLTDFFQTIDNVLNNTVLPQERAYLRFAHAETILPFASILGLFNDSSPLLANSSADFINNRKFRSSQISPFAANIAFVLYNCSSTSVPYRVQLLQNEQETLFPGCSEMYCPYTELKQLYSQYLYGNCNFNQLCGIQSCPVCPTCTQPPTSAHSTSTSTSLNFKKFSTFVYAIGIIGLLLLMGDL
jgi:multiple inositol-polyphosphate phosphatase/2,3-bisphosphoglycerate 3-phosphatase